MAMESKATEELFMFVLRIGACGLPLPDSEGSEMLFLNINLIRSLDTVL